MTTKFTTYRQERLYTIELEAPYPGAPVLVLCHGYGSGSGLWCFNLDALAKHFKVRRTQIRVIFVTCYPYGLYRCTL